MRHFECDYNEGAHIEILQCMMETNMEQSSGYGTDSHCENARELIKTACEAPDADVHFLVGGTQTNATVIKSALRSYQGIISAETGHINVHETGAIETDGHKVLALKETDGKISAAQIEEYCFNHVNDEGFEHTVQPKMVYISQPTELGTMYTKSELVEIHNVCKKCNLYLFIDGARLGYGLAAKGNDVELKDFAKYSDVFYIGGTKLGALMGEAVVITNSELKIDFRYLIKQKGALLAKGRLLGIQFETLFQPDNSEYGNLYMKGAANAIKMADKIRASVEKKEIPYSVKNNTNQIFLIMENEHLDKLRENFELSLQSKYDETRSVVRICTCWATQEEAVDELCAAIEAL